MAKIKTPEDIFGDLFRDMHASELWEDGKSIADMIPKKNPQAILRAYSTKKKIPGFDLKAFAEEHFDYAQAQSSDFKSDTSKSVDEHIEHLWEYLLREADLPVKGSSLIPLPHPYIVPGGRFQEIYYWDSYFTMLGLLESGRDDIVESMVRNFAYLIEHVGHIPNGNRTYYCGRSQPPFFACMVQLLAAEKGEEVLLEFLPSLLAEYDFWMRGSKKLDEDYPAHKRVVLLPDGILNRYWENEPVPRAEMYGDDLEILEGSNREPESLFRDVRAACESGWDFSSRWFRDPQDLGTIRTTELIPIDLNCLLYNLERAIRKGLKLQGKKKKAKKFGKRAKVRKRLINKYLWDEAAGVYTDFDFFAGESTGLVTAACLFPLFFGLAGPTQAKQTARAVEEQLLRDGGVVTTPVNSGQQWDAPNGWAPLQWIAIQGLRYYGFKDLAATIRQRWLDLNTKVYKETGKLMEKYDVTDLGKLSGGGEYPVQDGFGWTNGVLLALIREKDQG